jgi:hypothetical protein
MPVEKARQQANQLIRLALDPAVTKEEGRTAAYAAVKMIDRERLLDAPHAAVASLPAAPAMAPRLSAAPRQLGVGERPKGDPLASVHVLSFDFPDDPPVGKRKDFAFPQR